MHDSLGVFEKLLGSHFAWLFHDTIPWTCFGFCGAFLFGSRFVVQWLHSEKHQKIVVPPVFWHLSFWGSVINLIYAVHVDKLPLIVGAVFLPFIHGRNLVILRRDKSGVRSQTNNTPHMKYYTPLFALSLFGLALAGCSKHSPDASSSKRSDSVTIATSSNQPASTNRFREVQAVVTQMTLCTLAEQMPL